MAMQPVLQYDVAYKQGLNRLTSFFRYFTMIPHIIVLAVLGIALEFVTFIAWFAILITGKYPRGMWEFSLGVARYSARLSTYQNLLRDEFPPFGGGGDYPVQFELEYPDSMNRLTTFFRVLLAIPHMIVLYVLNALVGVVTLIAWFAILFTGNYPRGMFDFAVGVLRWQMRVGTYMLLLTDAYPPFTTAQVSGPSSGYATGMV